MLLRMVQTAPEVAELIFSLRMRKAPHLGSIA